MRNTNRDAKDGKAMRQLRAESGQMIRSIQGILAEYHFEMDGWHTHSKGRVVTQTGIRAISRADASDRYLILARWEGETGPARWSVLSPPKRRSRHASRRHARLLIGAAQVLLGSYRLSGNLCTRQPLIPETNPPETNPEQAGDKEAGDAATVRA